MPCQEPAPGWSRHEPLPGARAERTGDDTRGAPPGVHRRSQESVRTSGSLILSCFLGSSKDGG
eukprot:3562775-Pyramimonas_sp.AAC.1